MKLSEFTNKNENPELNFHAFNLPFSGMINFARSFHLVNLQLIV